MYLRGRIQTWRESIPNIMSHCLNIDPDRKPIRQKMRALDVEHYQALKEEVDKLLSNDFIKESFYLS